MSSTSAINSASTNNTSSATTDSASAFRNADFLKIMMTEITHQSPLDPSDTGKLVDNVQKLQELANTTFQKFRADITWGQQLVGQTVSVLQQPLTPAEKQSQLDKGLKPDVGFKQIVGKVSSYRIVDQKVYLTVGDKDYPMDNVKQIVPDSQQSQYLANMADQLLGKSVAYLDAKGLPASGKVTSVQYDKDSNLMLEIDKNSVNFNKVTQIGITN
jgi:flagellar hook assembly protein FlgD